MDEIIGRFDLLERNPESRPLGNQKSRPHCLCWHCLRNQGPTLCIAPKSRNRRLRNILDMELIKEAEKALSEKAAGRDSRKIRNTDRTTGANAFRPDYNIIRISRFTRRHYQMQILRVSRAKFRSIPFHQVSSYILKEMPNDYLGKGLSGGRIIVVPPAGSAFRTG